MVFFLLKSVKKNIIREKRLSFLLYTKKITLSKKTVLTKPTFFRRTFAGKNWVQWWNNDHYFIVFGKINNKGGNNFWKKLFTVLFVVIVQVEKKFKLIKQWTQGKKSFRKSCFCNRKFDWHLTILQKNWWD